MSGITLQPIKKQCPTVFDYLDYRKFILEFYSFKKSKNKNFSYRVFAKLASLNSPNYIKLIVDGNRNLTRENARKIALACRFKKSEENYFMALVGWNQSKDNQDREFYWNELVKCAPKDEIYVLNQSQVKILSHWYIMAMLDMIRLKDFKYDPKLITKRFSNLITDRQVIEAFDLLESKGLIMKTGDTFSLTNNIVFHGGDIPSELIKAFHSRVIPMGVEAIFRVPVTKREYGALSLAIREEDIPKLKSEMREFQKKILQYGASIYDGDNVYQLNLQFFPLTTDD